MAKQVIDTLIHLCIMFALSLVNGCHDIGGGSPIPPDTSTQVTITQGVWGNVWFWEGNFMPGSASGTITPVRRELLVFEATRVDSAVRSRDGGFYLAIMTRFVARTTSNSTGFFQITLPPGKYSVFVNEDKLFYASVSDGAGHLQPATVLPNSVTKVQIDITYKAVY
ncbi:MAG: hypothetical protein AAB393_14735 [Bacteroidota bacterium]